MVIGSNKVNEFKFGMNYFNSRNIQQRAFTDKLCSNQHAMIFHKIARPANKLVAPGFQTLEADLKAHPSTCTLAFCE